MMKVEILTLFPGMFDSFTAHSILKRAIESGLVSVQAHDLRQWTHDRHRTCDDRPFGGGPGMLMKPEPVFEAVDSLYGRRKSRRPKLIYLSPQGKRFDQKAARRLAREKRLVFLCGHYEGLDERVVEKLVDEEISIGDYVLTGGELAAMVVVDAVIRHIPGVLGKSASKEFESFSTNLLEYPQYTRPSVYRGLKVPPVLLSGNHEAIERWRQEEAYRRTLKRRPDLLKQNAERSHGRGGKGFRRGRDI